MQMRTNHQYLLIGKILFAIILLVVSFSAYALDGLSVVHAEKNTLQRYSSMQFVSIRNLESKTSQSMVELSQAQPNNIIGYEFGDLPTNAQNALIESIQSRPLGILDGGTYFIVGHYESDGFWGIGHLAAAVGSEPPDWGHSVWFITQGKKEVTQVALQGTSLFNDLMIGLPESFNGQINIQLKDKSLKTGEKAQATIFLFPWDKSQQWWYSFSWHGSTNLALDFAPVNVSPSNMWVLASANGNVTLVCGDGYQAAVDLSTLDGVMDYRHIDYNSFISQNVNNKTVIPGQKLAVLYNLEFRVRSGMGTLTKSGTC
jgi:hypothetical protein